MRWRLRPLARLPQKPCEPLAQVPNAQAKQVTQIAQLIRELVRGPGGEPAGLGASRALDLGILRGEDRERASNMHGWEKVALLSWLR